jgi:carbonic anhydrase
MGNLTALLSKILPSVYTDKNKTKDQSSNNPEFVDEVAAINVKRTLHSILKRSPILKEMIDTGQIGIIGGFHDISTGVVTFFDDTAIINQPQDSQ